jgi:Ceramidase
LRVVLIVGLAIAACAVVFILPPLPQDPSYHQFADHTPLWGVPNFWNVVSNLGFLAAAVWGVLALRSPASFLESWERVAYGVLLAGVAAVAFGSGYYHAAPDNATLFWDRLPMTIVFMSLLATTIGERIDMPAGKLLLFPLLAVGVGSVIYWRIFDDLRPYVMVQFYPMVALPLMLLLFPPKYSGTVGIVAMICLYGLAKIFEIFDQQIAAILSSGGHPWKHVAGAAAMICYVTTVARRRPLVS